MNKKKWCKPIIIKLNSHINSGGFGYSYPEYIRACFNGNIVTSDIYLTAPGSSIIFMSTSTTIDAQDGICS